jgi:hypothetical protein
MREFQSSSSTERDSAALSYMNLSNCRMRGMRNGNWRRLNFVERGLYNCVLQLARTRQKIVNAKLVGIIKELIQRLLSTVRAQIVKVGQARVHALREGLERSGLIERTPWVKGWLIKPETAFYFGLMEWANG